MSKAIMISIKPQWAELIANGEKTIEVRKSEPSLKPPFKCYIYVTRGYCEYVTPNGMICHDNGCQNIIGEFICDKIYLYTTTPHKENTDITDDEMIRYSKLTLDELHDYEIARGLYGLFGWHISDLVIYDKPKEIDEFLVLDKEFIKSCPYRYRNLLMNDYDCENSFGKLLCRGQCAEGTKQLTHPPQSWCYVEI